MPNKIAFIFKKGRKSRLSQNTSTGKFPTEFFYGYVQLKAQGHDVSIIDEFDLNLVNKSNKVVRAIDHLTYSYFGLHFKTILTLLSRKNLNTLNQFSTLVVTTNSLGFAFSFLKKFGFIKQNVLFIGMGVCDLMNNSVRKKSLEWLLKSIRTLVISKSELDYLNNTFAKNDEIYYIPFGVDTNFWLPIKKETTIKSKYVLSIGNDLNRDYATLISSWEDFFPHLKIITSLPISSDKNNIEIISGDWRSQLLSDNEMLELIQNALFVVIPLKPTMQPAGQSVCLQSMACSKAVIISNIAGIWDKEELIDNKIIKLIPCNNIDFLSKTIQTFLANPKKVESMGREARKVVEKNYYVESMAESILFFAEESIQHHKNVI